MKGHPLLGKLREWDKRLQESPLLARHPKIRVRASLGRGNWARVPWIAFLHEDETTSTQRGIYPVYLFHEDMSLVDLSLNQGFTQVMKDVPASTRERVMRDRANRIAGLIPKEMKAGFKTGARTYGRGAKSSTNLAWGYGVGNILHKDYPKNQLPNEEELYRDLEQMLSIYEHVVKNKPADLHETTTDPTSRDAVAPQSNGSHLAQLDSLRDQTTRAGLTYPDPLLAALLVGLSCQPFTLLAGPTGTGKTRLATTLGELPEYQVAFVEVEGGWLDSASAFGYISPVTQEFVPGPVLLQLLGILDKTRDEPSANPVLVLDELNVSPAHIYLAPLLSVLERAYSEDETLPLTVAQGGLSATTRTAFEEAAQEHSGLLSVEDAGPFCRLVLKIPPTLRVIGTLNFDASTEDLAPKLLSRSFVVWFDHPEVQEDMNIKRRSRYNMDPVAEPTRVFARAVRDLAEHGLPVSARAVTRARSALQGPGTTKDSLVDILLSGLVLPQYQTLTDEHPLVRSQPEFLDGLPDGLFKTQMVRMKDQIKAEGMTSLWLVA